MKGKQLFNKLLVINFYMNGNLLIFMKLFYFYFYFTFTMYKFFLTIAPLERICLVIFCQKAKLKNILRF